jgi:short-subunit dehydrogenase
MMVVTGASQGLGLACARALLADTDANVLITGRSQAKLEAARAGLPPEQAARLRTLVCDQSRRDHVERLVSQLTDPATGVTGAILAVGVNPLFEDGPRRLHAVSPATIDATIRTNCIHAMLLTAGLLGRFKERKGGALLWIGSRGAEVGLPGAAVYCATKSFLDGLAHAAHNEYARFGVRVHLVHPGPMRTPRTALVADRFAARHGVPIAEVDTVARTIVARFLGVTPSLAEVTT